jgi:hypothetical protein
VFGLTWSGHKLMILHTRGEHTNHYQYILSVNCSHLTRNLTRTSPYLTEIYIKHATQLQARGQFTFISEYYKKCTCTLNMPLNCRLGAGSHSFQNTSHTLFLRPYCDWSAELQYNLKVQIIYFNLCNVG